MLNEKMGKLNFWLFMLGLTGTFLPMHWLGLEGMPRRYASYEVFAKATPDAVFWNRVESISSFLMVAAVLLLVINIVVSLRRGRSAGNNPWGARTLEWMIASPPPYYNFKKIPIVTGLPYDFSQPLPYRNLDDPEQDPFPAPIEAILPRPSVAAASS
jgi:heme/copper-type cytochrome/quinol oxidase subunit 1